MVSSRKPFQLAAALLPYNGMGVFSDMTNLWKYGVTARWLRR